MLAWPSAGLGVMSLFVKFIDDGTEAVRMRLGGTSWAAMLTFTFD